MYSMSEWMFVLESSTPILLGLAYQRLKTSESWKIKWRKGSELSRYDACKWTFKMVIQLNTATQSWEYTFELTHTLCSLSPLFVSQRIGSRSASLFWRCVCACVCVLFWAQKLLHPWQRRLMEHNRTTLAFSSVACEDRGPDSPCECVCVCTMLETPATGLIVKDASCHSDAIFSLWNTHLLSFHWFDSTANSKLYN